MIKVSKSKCIQCGKCVDVCPFTVMQMKDGYPAIAEGKNCIECMHCAIACEQEALTNNNESVILKKAEKVCDEAFVKDLKMHLMTRRSFRHFSEKQVDLEVVKDALEVASWAPSAKNQHPAKWIIVNDRGVIARMMDVILEYTEETGISPEILTEYKDEHNNVVMGNAGTLILCYARNNAINSPADTAIAMTTAELMLQAQGIGTCWAGYLTRSCNNIDKIKELLPAIPENSSFYGAFMLGYPENEEYPFVPVRKADIKIV